MLAGDIAEVSENGEIVTGTDGKVDGVDFSLAKSYMYQEGCDILADFDGSGVVTTNDIAVLTDSLKERWGQIY